MLDAAKGQLVCDDAELDRAVSAASVGRFFNCGQACLAIKRLYLFDSIADEFIDKLVAKAEKLVVGNGLEKGTMIGPLHTSIQRQEVEEQVQDAVDRGATVLCGGKRPQGEQYEKGFFYLPTLLTDVDESSKVIQEEVFGPALPIIRVKDLDEGIAKANNCIFGLGSSVWTRDLKRAAVAGERIESGYTWINSPQIIYDELPFGDSLIQIFNCGQACLAIKRLYLFDSIADEFIDKLVAKANKLVVGNGLEKGTMIGPLHTSSQRQEVEEQIQDGQTSDSGAGR